LVSAVVLAAGAGQGSAARARNALISFWSDRGGVPGVWVMRPDGSGLRLVTGTRWAAKRGEFSPDGRLLAFDGPPGRIPRLDFDIQVIRLAGRGRRRLTRGPARDVQASWAPDGTTLVFQRRESEFGPQAVWRVGLDGRGLRRLTAGYAPSWSPDGRTIVFARGIGRSGQSELYLIGAEGRSARRLTRTPNDEVPAAFSPDGRRILVTVFSRSRPGSWIEVLRRDGRGRRRLTSNGRDVAAAWSPDGRRILFTRISRRGFSENGDIYVMKSDGSGVRGLTSGRFDDNATSWQRASQAGTWTSSSLIPSGS
jgi:Tol biopolymer transport system component